MRQKLSINFWKIFTTLGNQLGAIPAMFWFVFYLAAVFIFAVIYTGFPKGFYHSTSQYEKNLELDKKSIENELSYLIHRKFTKNPALSTSFSSVKVRSFSVKEDGFKFETTDTSTHNLIIGDLYFDATFAFERNKDSLFTLKREKKIILEPISSKDKILEILTEYWDKLFRISSKLAKKISYYGQALAGFPQNSTGNFERMFYLSAVTITTLGYGDIVPITPVTRLLVWVEATLGVFIVGLFFNSLANQIGASRQDQL